MNIKLTISIILMVIGIAGIIISQTVSFTTVSQNSDSLGTYYIPRSYTDYGLKNGILYGGIGFLLIGGVILAISLGRTRMNK